MSKNMTWKTVTNKHQHAASRGGKPIECEIASDYYNQGFRTFENLAPVFSRVLLRKLQSHYRTVQFTALSETGEVNRTEHQYVYVHITMRGPQNDVNAALEDAEVFLATDKQRDNERYIQAKVSFPGCDDPSMRRVYDDRSAMCPDLFACHVNFSPAANCFFVTTVLLKHELEEMKEMGQTVQATRLALMERVRAHLQADDKQTFRTPMPAPRGRGGIGGRGGPGRGGAPRFHDAHHQSWDAGLPHWIFERMDECKAMAPHQSKQALRALYDDIVREVKPHLQDKVLAWLSLNYEVEKTFILADFAQNEMTGLTLRPAKELTHVVQVHLPPVTGEVPFTHRQPRITLDDTVHIYVEHTRETVETTVYSVSDFMLQVHVKDDETNLKLKPALEGRCEVAITFDAGRQVNYRTGLQRCLTREEAFDRLRGYGHWHQSKAPCVDEVAQMMRSDADFRRAAGGATEAPMTKKERREAGREAGRGRGAGNGHARGERGGRAQGKAAMMHHEHDDSSDGDEPLLYDDNLLVGLYREQLAAAYAILNRTAKRIFVDGPGGTGKTETLVRTIALLRERSIANNTETRILVVAPTVAACDVLGGRIVKYMTASGLSEDLQKHFIRLYSQSFPWLYSDPLLFQYANRPMIDDAVTGTTRRAEKKNELVWTHRFEKESEYMARTENIERARIVVCSAATARNLPHAVLDRLTHVFMDEAGCTSLSEALGLINVTPPHAQLIFSGDPTQLLPRTRCPFTKQALQTNPLQFLDSAMRIPLRTSHRSSGALVALQSMLFYDGQLRAAADATTPGGDFVDETCYPRWTGHNGRPSAARILHNDGDEARVNGSDIINKSEVVIIDHIVRSLAEQCDVKAEDVGVICEYPHQLKEIRNRLSMLGFKAVRVSSVDDFQGNEREVMIAALTRSTYDPKDTDAIDMHKLCTVLTRARSLALFVGNVPVYLQRDEHKHKNRKSRGRFTMLVDDLKEKMAVDGYDYASETWEGVSPLQVGTRVKVRDFQPKERREEVDRRRTLVTREEVLKHPHEYFIGVVVKRDSFRVMVRNRFKSVLDVAIDEDIATGQRGFAVLPGDVVAVLIDEDVSRWMDAAEIGEQPSAIYLQKAIPGKQDAPMDQAADFVNCLDIAVKFGSDAAHGQQRPTGSIVCFLHETDVYPSDVRGYVHGAFFQPKNASLPQLPILRDLTVRAEPEEGTEHKAQIVSVQDANGEFERKYIISEAKSTEQMPTVGLSTREYESLLDAAPDLSQAGFIQLAGPRILRQQLYKINEIERESDTHSLATIEVIAPAVGLAECVENSPDAHGGWWANKGYSEQLLSHRKLQNGPVPDMEFDSDGFSILPPKKRVILMVGVRFTVRFFSGEGGLPRDYAGPVITTQPSVVWWKRGSAVVPEADEEDVAGLNEILRSNGSAMFGDWWRGPLVHLAHNAAALVLLNEVPEAALLLRQTLAPMPQDGMNMEEYDAPEWFVAGVSSEDGANWHLQSKHVAAGFEPYTSFTQPHHCFGDMLVQHLLLIADGQKYDNHQVLLANVRRFAHRLNAQALQGSLVGV